MNIIVLFALILFAEIATAGTAVLTWDAYPESPNFKELRLYRGTGTACGSSTPLSPLLKGTPAVQVTIPKGTPTPNTYTDTAAPDIVGMLCYEINAVDLAPVPGGTTTTPLESAHSNRAIKFLVSPVPAPTTLDVKP